jgi:ankyrin repeat protein
MKVMATGYVTIGSLLIERGANVNARDVAGYTPLYFAIDKDHKDCVKLLLQNKAGDSAKFPTDPRSSYKDEILTKPWGKEVYSHP